MSKNTYGFGRQQEHRVARSLRTKGAKVTLNQGSRWAADLTAEFPSGKTWKVQFKASEGSTPASPYSKELGRLKQSATKSDATPVVAKVTPECIGYSSARSGKKLRP